MVGSKEHCSCAAGACILQPRSVCILTQAPAAAGGWCVHVECTCAGRAQGLPPPPLLFLLKAGEHNPSAHPGGREL